MGRWNLIWNAQVEADVEATPPQVWDVLSDVPRVGEWSHECRNATWLDGHREATVGAQFAGSNKAGMSRWRRRCTVTESEPARLLVYRTSGGIPPDSTEWRLELEGLPTGGTRIRESFRILQRARPVEAVIYLLLPQHRDRREALRGDLVRLGQVAAGKVASTQS
jgi:hypothetical protein